MPKKKVLKVGSILRALSRLKKSWQPPEEFFRKWNRYRKMLYETAEYKTFLLEVRARAGGLCEECGKPGREVHHKIRVYDDPSLALVVDNGQLLCKKCHNLQHRKDKKR